MDTNALSKIGLVSSARVVSEEDDLTIMSSAGVVLRTKVKDVTPSGRSTRGVKLMNMHSGDNVVSLAIIADADLRQAGVAQG